MTVQRAIQTVTAKIQAELDSGRRSAKIDAHDLVEALLAIGDELERQPAIARPNQLPLVIAAPSEILCAANDAFLMLRRKNRAIDGKLTPDERQVMNALELALKLNGIVNQ